MRACVCGAQPLCHPACQTTINTRQCLSVDHRRLKGVHSLNEQHRDRTVDIVLHLIALDSADPLRGRKRQFAIHPRWAAVTCTLLLQLVQGPHLQRRSALAKPGWWQGLMWPPAPGPRGVCTLCCVRRCHAAGCQYASLMDALIREETGLGHGPDRRVGAPPALTLAAPVAAVVLIPG